MAKTEDKAEKKAKLKEEAKKLGIRWENWSILRRYWKLSLFKMVIII